MNMRSFPPAVHPGMRGAAVEVSLLLLLGGVAAPMSCENDAAVTARAVPARSVRLKPLKGFKLRLWSGGRALLNGAALGQDEWPLHTCRATRTMSRGE